MSGNQLSPLAREFISSNTDPVLPGPRDQGGSGDSIITTNALDSTLSNFRSELLSALSEQLDNVRKEFASRVIPSEFPELKSDDPGKAKVGELLHGNPSHAGSSGTAPVGLPASKELLGALEARIANSPETKHFENATYLDVHDWSAVIEDGFRVLPHPGHPEPYRFSIEQDETYKRIFHKFEDKIKNPIDNGALQEYHSMFCSTFYLSCSVAALAAACSEGFRDISDGYVGITREQAEIFCSVTKTLAEVESQARARFAFLRIKNDPHQDPAFQRVVAEEVNKPDFTSQGSSSVQSKHDEYCKLLSVAISKEGAKIGAAGRFEVDKPNKGKKRNPKLKQKETEKGSKSEGN